MVLMALSVNVSMPFNGLPSFLPRKVKISVYAQNNVSMPFNGLPSFLQIKEIVIMDSDGVSMPFNGLPSFLLLRGNKYENSRWCVNAL